MIYKIFFMIITLNIISFSQPKNIVVEGGLLNPKFNQNVNSYLIKVPVYKNKKFIRIKFIYENFIDSVYVNNKRANIYENILILDDSIYIFKFWDNKNVYKYYFFLDKIIPKMKYNSKFNLNRDTIYKSFELVKAINQFGDTMWSTNSSKRTINYSTNGGKTWDLFLNVKNVSQYTSLLNLKTGLLVSEDDGTCSLINKKNKLIQKKFKFYNNYNFSHLANYSNDTIVLLGGYGTHKSVELWLSRDCGLNWNRIFFDTTIVSSYNNYHVHGCSFDENLKRIWLSTGDGNNKFLCYSDDWGATWKFIYKQGENCENCRQVTEIIPLEYGTLFTSDDYSIRGGFLFLPNLSKDFISSIDLILPNNFVEFANKSGLQYYGQKVLKSTINNQKIFLLPLRQNSDSDTFKVIASFDGLIWYLVYTHNISGDYFRSIIGPDKEKHFEFASKYLIQVSNDPSFSNFIEFESKDNLLEIKDFLFSYYRIKPLNCLDEGSFSIISKVEKYNSDLDNLHVNKETPILNIFPNPFSKKTKILINNIGNSPFNLSLYNILGQKIDEIKYDNMLSNSIEIEYSNSKLASNIYILLFVNKYFSLARKIGVVK